MYLFEAFSQDDIANVTDPNEPLAKFVSGTSGRGSWDIIWSCSLTILLCCWVSTYPNVPGPNDKWWHATVDKLNMACIGMLGPDFLFGIAMGQMSSAIRSVRALRRDKNLTNGVEWTLTHGFFADMGGFYLATPDFPRGFPINAEQFHYLLKHRYIDFPDMNLVGIDEKNQSDGFSKLLAMVSAAWFFIQEFDHLWHGNPITVLELTAMTFAFVMICTSVCWYYKPCIAKPFYLQTRNGTTVKRIRRNAKRLGHEFCRDQWYRTPLEFIGNRRFSVYNHWAYYVRLSQRLHVPIFSRPVLSRPWDRWPSDIFFAPEPVILPLGAVVIVGFSASFLIGWNFYFPTGLERVLWRSASVYNAFFALFAGLYYLIEVIRFHRSFEEGLAATDASGPAGASKKAKVRAVVRAMTGKSSRAAGSGNMPSVAEAGLEDDDDDDDDDVDDDRRDDDDDDDDGNDNDDGDGNGGDDYRNFTRATYQRELAARRMKKEKRTDDDDKDKDDDGPGAPPWPLKRTSTNLSQASTLGGDAMPSPPPPAHPGIRRAGSLSSASSADSGFHSDVNDVESLSSARMERPRLLRRLALLLRTLTPYNDPSMRVPLRVLIPISFVCLFYMVARCIFYFLDFQVLRNQPRGVYFADFDFSIWGSGG